MKTVKVVRLLIVDDEPEMRDVMSELARETGADVLTCAHGGEARTALERETFSAVITDLHMPVLSGLELLAWAREQGLTIPFVIVTGLGKKEDAITALRLGATEFLEKPFDKKAFLHALKLCETKLCETKLQGPVPAPSGAHGLSASALRESKLSTLASVTGSVVHEINNPLSVIMGKAERIRSLSGRPTLDCQAIADAAGKIEDTSMRIGHLVKGLRGLARDEAQDPIETLALAPIVADAIEMCRDRFNRSAVEILVDPIPESMQIKARPYQLTEVFLNLLLNAQEAAGESHTGESATRQVRLSSRTDGDWICIQISDTGPGISVENRARLFQPYFTTHDERKASGLGLAASRQLAVLLGGELLYVEKSQGACFELRMKKASAVEVRGRGLGSSTQPSRIQPRA